jgi:hypothetical protein
MSPNPRLATTPHACQSQSPAQVFTEVNARGDGNTEGSGVGTLEEAEMKVEEDIDVEVDDVDWLLALVVDTPVLLVDDEDEVDAVELELVVVGVAVTNSDLVVLTIPIRSRRDSTLDRNPQFILTSSYCPINIQGRLNCTSRSGAVVR